MRTGSSKAVGRCASRATAWFVLGVLLSAAALLAAALRPVSLSIASTGCAISSRDADAPVAIEEGEAQSRVVALRPARDGRAHGVRSRDVAPVLPGASGPSWTARARAEEVHTTTTPRDEPPRGGRVRRHAELMVFLI